MKEPNQGKPAKRKRKAWLVRLDPEDQDLVALFNEAVAFTGEKRGKLLAKLVRQYLPSVMSDVFAEKARQLSDKVQQQKKPNHH